MPRPPGRTARTAIVVFIVLLTLARDVHRDRGARAAVAAAARRRRWSQSFRAALATPQAAGRAGRASATGSPAIIPSNAIAAAAQSAMLPLVVFAMFFGFALTRIEATRKARMLRAGAGASPTR